MRSGFNRTSITVVVVGFLLLVGSGLILSSSEDGLFGPDWRRTECPTTMDEVIEMYGPGDWKISNFYSGYIYELDELTDEHSRTFDLPAGSTLYAYWMIVPAQEEPGGLGLEIAGPAHPELLVDSDSDTDSVFSNLYIICE